MIEYSAVIACALVVGSCGGNGNMKSDAIGRIAAILYTGEEYADLFEDIQFRVNIPRMAKRNVELRNSLFR